MANIKQELLKIISREFKKDRIVIITDDNRVDWAFHSDLANYGVNGINELISEELQEVEVTSVKEYIKNGEQYICINYD